MLGEAMLGHAMVSNCMLNSAMLGHAMVYNFMLDSAMLSHAMVSNCMLDSAMLGHAMISNCILDSAMLSHSLPATLADLPVPVALTAVLAALVGLLFASEHRHHWECGYSSSAIALFTPARDLSEVHPLGCAGRYGVN